MRETKGEGKENPNPHPAPREREEEREGGRDKLTRTKLWPRRGGFREHGGELRASSKTFE